MILRQAPHRRPPSECAVRFALPDLRPALLILFLLIFATHPTSVFTQQSEDSGDDVLRLSTNFVTVPVLVTDAAGRRVFNLKPEEFVLRDNGRVFALQYFATGTDRVALAFALDASGSAREIIPRQREIALALFSRFGSGSRVAVLRFAETAEMVAPFTMQADNALSAFRFSAPANRPTAIFDAAAMAVRSFDAPESDSAERRIIILISDGLDTASKVSASAVIDQARALNVSFYVIHLPLFTPREGRLAARPASKGFRQLAERTGGRYFMVGDAKSALDPRAGYDLAPVFKSIEEDLQSQYVLGYYLDEAARVASFHRIEISVVARSKQKLRVRSLREGYNLK